MSNRKSANRKSAKRRAKSTRPPLVSYLGDANFLAVCKALFEARGNRQRAADRLSIARQHLIGTLFGRFPAAAELFPATSGRPRRQLGEAADFEREYTATTSARGAALGIPADFMVSIGVVVTADLAAA